MSEVSFNNLELYKTLEKLYNLTFKISLPYEVTNLKYFWKTGLPGEKYDANCCKFTLFDNVYYEIACQGREFKRAVFFFKCTHGSELLFSIIADWGNDEIELDNNIHLHTMLEIVRNLRLLLEILSK